MARPFLDWAGKAERPEITVPTLPLFVHERLSTQAILQSVKSHKRDRQQSLALFADEELDVTDRLLKAYEHPTPWVNRLILGDSLVVMNSLLQYEGLGGHVQMIYMDPPYGVSFGSNFQPFVRRREVKHGDDAELSREHQALPFTYNGTTYHPGRGRCWKTSARTDDGSPSGMDRLAVAARLIAGEGQLRFKSYLDDFGFRPLSNWWDGLGGAANPIHVVQTSEEIVLRKGRVVVTNWHVLAPQDLNQVDGVNARVVKRGRESDTAIVARVLGREIGAKGNILVLNDEAHHAYRIMPDSAGEEQTEEEIEEADRREATVWIEGLDRIHRLRGINLCVDVSATPFFLNRAGHDPGRPFPWAVSDFGLIDAIESGLVKIPQRPVQDATGETIPAYLNVWKWVIEKLTPGERGGRRGQLNPVAVLRWAQQPITQLAGLWEQMFHDWAKEAAEGKRPPVPPVFIVVCRDTRLAKVVHEWLTGGGDGAPPPTALFRNAPGCEYTVRIDSRVVEDLASGVARSDESRRLRFVLDTIGKTAWPAGRVPDEYFELVDKLNRKAMEAVPGAGCRHRPRPVSKSRH